MQSLNPSPRAIDSPRQTPGRTPGRIVASLVGWLALWMLVIVFPCGGASCPRRRPVDVYTPPVLFKEKPTLEQIAAQFNKTAAIERLNSGTIALSSPDAPMELSGNLSWHRPYDFRLQAYPGTRVMGDALDAGSNADNFWFLTKLPGEPATLYFASHQQYENRTEPRRILPVSPLWIREALGIIEFDPNGHHEGPIDLNGNVEIRTILPTNRGSYQRIAIIEPTRATLRQLILKDPDNKVVATAQQSEHQYYNAIDASLPHRVDIALSPEQGNVMAFTIKVGSYMINQSSGNEAQRYTMPESTGFRSIDLVQLNASLEQGAAPPATPPPGPQGRTANGFTPVYR